HRNLLLALPFPGALLFRRRALHMNFGALVVRADRIREFLRARVAAMNGGRLFPVGHAGSSLERIARPRVGGERIGGRGAGGEGVVGPGAWMRRVRLV